MKEDTQYSLYSSVSEDNDTGLDTRRTLPWHESGELCGIDIDELEGGASPFRNTHREYSERTTWHKSEEEVLEARRKLRDEEEVNNMSFTERKKKERETRGSDQNGIADLNPSNALRRPY